MGLLAGVIDKGLLAGPVLLAHGEPLAAEPLAIQIAEPGVAVPGGMLLEVLQVEQFQGNAGLLPLGVEVGAIRLGPGVRGGRGRAVEPGLQSVVGQGLGRRPVQAGMRSAADHRGHAAQADAETGGHLAVAAAHGPLLAENLTDLTHG